MSRALLLLGGLLIGSHTLAGMEDDPLLGMLMADKMEARYNSDGTQFAWDAQGWIGKDLHKAWFKTEGDQRSGIAKSAEFQALYSRGFNANWDWQIGARHDLRPEPRKNWAVLGLHGLSPWFFEVDSALFFAPGGLAGLRVEAEYEFLFTQRLILSPALEMNLFSKDDVETAKGSGLSTLELGLRLRYEIRREIAPYIGIHWERKYGNTAEFARLEGDKTTEWHWVAGLRWWF